jgi:hypothetical protein
VASTDWRAIYAQLFDAASYHRLSSHARLVLLTARLGSQNTFAGIYRYSIDTFMRQTGLDRAAVEAAFTELDTARPPWLLRDAEVLWTTSHDLLRDPTTGMNTSAKRFAASRLLALFPQGSPVVRKFKHVNEIRGTTRGDYQGGGRGEDRDLDRDRDRDRDRGAPARAPLTPLNSLSVTAESNHDPQHAFARSAQRVGALIAQHLPDTFEALAQRWRAQHPEDANLSAAELEKKLAENP